MDEPYFRRLLRKSLDEALLDTPVVCLLGPRQVGKSTLARHAGSDRVFYDFDDGSLAATALADPPGFVDALPEFVALDEIQRVPELTRAIKISVDRNRRPGRFLITGSANLLQLPRLSESLAGRMEIIQLHPFCEAEKERSEGGFLSEFIRGNLKPQILPEVPGAGEDLVNRMLCGGYPEASFRPISRAKDWHRNYIKTLMERDVKDIANVGDVGDLAKLLETLAHQSGSLINVSNISRDLGTARVTVDNHIQILERLFLVRMLPAWHKSRAKRLIRSPKIHLLDSGLAGTLIGLEPDEWNTKRTAFGGLLESFVLQQLIAQAAWTDHGLKFYHYRDKDQREVDCVITKGTKVWGVEVKASRMVDEKDTLGLKALAAQAGDDFQGGIVFYGGSSVIRLGQDGYFAVPLSRLWAM